jgi:hypothetical protein
MMEGQAGINFIRRPSMATMCMVVRNFCNNRREAGLNRSSLNAMCMTARNYCMSGSRTSLT